MPPVKYQSPEYMADELDEQDLDEIQLFAPLKDKNNCTNTLADNKSKNLENLDILVDENYPQNNYSDFSTICLDTWLSKVLESISIKSPSDVQKATIPALLEGKDVLAASKTGSGKTAAFALPILQKLSRDPFGHFAIILTPTR